MHLDTMAASFRQSAAPFYLIALLAFAGVGIALLSQHVFSIPPCAWCVLQRLIFIVLGLCSLVAGVLRQLGHSGSATLFSLLGLATSVGGMLAAWYQASVAQHLFSCDQTFADRFITQSGLESSLPWLFGIYASCMDARQDLLGIEYAYWSLGLFVLLGLGLLLTLLTRRRA